MIALPFPQRATVPAHLSARLVAPLTANGYDFGALDPYTLPDIAGGYLHRVIGYSFALEVPEETFVGSQVEPFAVQLINTATEVGEFAKPIRLPRYCTDAPALEYIRTAQRSTSLRVQLSGRLSRDSVALLGFASVAAVLSFHIQTLQDAEWAERFEKGEI